MMEREDIHEIIRKIRSLEPGSKKDYLRSYIDVNLIVEKIEVYLSMKNSGTYSDEFLMKQLHVNDTEIFEYESLGKEKFINKRLRKYKVKKLVG